MKIVAAVVVLFVAILSAVTVSVVRWVGRSDPAVIGDLAGASDHPRAASDGARTLVDSGRKENMENAVKRPQISEVVSQRLVHESPVAELIVRINGTVLGESQLSELTMLYGQRPASGDYWYDARSGLYGLMGQPCAGTIAAGHNFGHVPRDASRGDSGVLLNGRELPVGEWIFLSQVSGSPVQPGSYWLDAAGNAGVEGIDVPLINLFLAAQQLQAQVQGRAAGGGGDNFWSTSFSAGNCNSDNSQGYVSVPGYGPVGYGF
ncbi:MAG: hypothetical protein HYX75_01515 [Acidobacteria bacterium]|nr:hypothetical protein [Acidobacteriota bacterium]